MTIEQMQNAILAAGYQFQENIFNDGNNQNCYIRFTLCKSPHYFSDFDIQNEWREAGNTDEWGWGRFERSHAWRQAYAAIIEY